MARESTPITTPPGTSSDSFQWGSKQDVADWQILGEALDRNRDEWDWWAVKVDLLTAAMAGEFVFFPSRKAPRTIAIFRVDGFSTGNRQVEVLWTWGEITPESVQALTDAAVAYARSEGAGRVFIPACKTLYRQLMTTGFKPTKVQMIKEL